MNATRELATFLRARRERLAPGDVDLPEFRRLRRTPGLRREEVLAPLQSPDQRLVIYRAADAAQSALDAIAGATAR